METVKTGKVLKIKHVGKLWRQIRQNKASVILDCRELEQIDGAGLESLVFLLEQNRLKPDKYQITNLSREMKEKVLKYSQSSYKREDVL